MAQKKNAPKKTPYSDAPKGWFSLGTRARLKS